MSLCQNGIRGQNHFTFMWIVLSKKAAFVHMRLAKLCAENGVPICVCRAVEVAWLPENFRHSSTRV